MGVIEPNEVRGEPGRYNWDWDDGRGTLPGEGEGGLERVGDTRLLYAHRTRLLYTYSLYALLYCSLTSVRPTQYCRVMQSHVELSCNVMPSWCRDVIDCDSSIHRLYTVN